MSIADALAFAQDWVDGFNSRDVDRIMAHYADDITLISPAYLKFTAGRTDVISGKDELRGFFSTALERYPEIRFTLLEVGEGSRGLCIRYHTALGDQIVMECFERDATGLAVRAASHYLPAPSGPEG